MPTMKIGLFSGPLPESELAVPGYQRAALQIDACHLDCRSDGMITNAVRVDFNEIAAHEEVTVTHYGVDDGQGGLGIAPLPWHIHLHPGRPTPVRLPPGTIQVFDGEEDMP